MIEFETRRELRCEMAVGLIASYSEEQLRPIVKEDPELPIELGRRRSL